MDMIDWKFFIVSFLSVAFYCFTVFEPCPILPRQLLFFFHDKVFFISLIVDIKMNSCHIPLVSRLT